MVCYYSLQALVCLCRTCSLQLKAVHCTLTVSLTGVFLQSSWTSNINGTTRLHVESLIGPYNSVVALLGVPQPQVPWPSTCVNHELAIYMYMQLLYIHACTYIHMQVHWWMV